MSNPKPTPDEPRTEPDDITFSDGTTFSDGSTFARDEPAEPAKDDQSRQKPEA